MELAPRGGRRGARARAGAAARRRPHPARPLTRRGRIRSALVLCAAGAALLGGLAAAQSDVGRDLMGDAGLAPPAEAFAALAFARPAEPFAAVGGRLPVAFRIENHEGVGRAYSWAVVLGDGAGEGAAARGRAGVADGGDATITTSVPLACAGPRVRLRVLLDDPEREIGAWVACPAGEVR